MAKDKLEDWDETAANNLDIGGISIAEGMAPANVNNAMREEMEQVAKWLGADTLASAGTVDLGSVPGRYVSITGTTTITALGTIKEGTIKYVLFTGALTLTHNGTSLILPGAANVLTETGDTAIFVSEGSGNWRCAGYQRAAAPPVRQVWEYIGSYDISSSTSYLDFLNLGAFRSLRFHGRLLQSVDDSGVLIATSTNNGSSFRSGVYQWAALRNTGSTASASINVESIGFPLLASVVGNDSSEGSSFSGILEEFNKAYNTKGQVSILNKLADNSPQAVFAGWHDTGAVACNAIRVLPNTGTLMQGYFVLEGMRG